MQTWSLRRSELFTVTRQVAPLNCTPGGNVVAMYFMQRHVCTVLDDCFFSATAYRIPAYVCKSAIADCLVMAALCNKAGHYIFAL